MLNRIDRDDECFVRSFVLLSSRKRLSPLVIVRFVLIKMISGRQTSEPSRAEPSELHIHDADFRNETPTGLSDLSLSSSPPGPSSQITRITRFPLNPADLFIPLQSFHLSLVFVKFISNTTIPSKTTASLPRSSSSFLIWS